jgi:hypothetical protein
MLPRMPFLRGVGRGVGAIVCALVAVSAVAADALFPKPLHLVRRIEDPVAGTTITVDEYCAGNRIVTVHGHRVAIVDYGEQRILEIDRRAGTYSVTRFEEAASVQTKSASKPRAPLTTIGADSYEAHFDDGLRLEIVVDRGVELSRDAVEALIGAAYPGSRSPEHDAVLEAARGPRDRVATESVKGYALPRTQNLAFVVDGRALVLRNTIVSVTDELAPAELLVIPAGARQVESRNARVAPQ